MHVINLMTISEKKFNQKTAGVFYLEEKNEFWHYLSTLPPDQILEAGTFKIINPEQTLSYLTTRLDEDEVEKILMIKEVRDIIQMHGTPWLRKNKLDDLGL